jgi:hypothetical protein
LNVLRCLFVEDDRRYGRGINDDSHDRDRHG